MRIERELVALLGFLADGEEAHPRSRDREHLFREDRSHRGELEQVLGAAVGVRARVDQDRRPLPRRDRHRDRRPAHAGHSSEQDEAGREHRSGAARRHNRVCFAVGDGLDGSDERAVGFRAECVRRLFVHADDLRGRDELELAGVEACGAEDHGLQGLRSSLLRTLDDRTRATVAAHRIDGDPDHDGELTEP